MYISKNKNIYLLAALFLTVFALRAWTFYNPIVDVDEAQFAGFAHVLVNGGIPYIDSLDTKPIGIYAFFALIFSLFGHNNMIAVHVATSFVVFFTALFCFRIASRLYSEKAGMFAAFFYAVFTTTYVPKFIGTSIAIVMMLPLTASIAYMIEWETSRRLRHMFVAGLLWGVACLFKYQAGINLVVAGVYLLVIPSLVRKKAAFAAFLAGGLAVGLIFAIYLKSVGAWDAFSFWSLSGSARYIGAAAQMSDFWNGLLVRGGTIVASSFLLWYLASRRIACIASGIAHKNAAAFSSGELLVAIWLLLSIIPVCTGGKFYGHYFLQIHPALCILASARAVQFFERKPWRIQTALFILGIVIPVLGFFTARFYADGMYRTLHEENPKTYIPVAQYIMKNTGIDERIFVWGFATPIYTYANRLPASRFLWCDWLTGRISGTPSAKDPAFDTQAFITPGSWKLFFEDMAKNKPVYFIDTSPGNHHDYGKYPIKKFPELEKYIKENYLFETTIDGMEVYRMKAPLTLTLSPWERG